MERAYPGAGALGLSLLRSMLKFNPADRISADAALEHPYFDDIKKKGYINTYRTNNQHLFSESEQLANALNPIPLKEHLEKIGESQEHLLENVSLFFLASRRLLNFSFSFIFIDYSRSSILSK